MKTNSSSLRHARRKPLLSTRSSAGPGAATPVAVGDLDRVFKGFADPTRLRILSVLAAGELCVCDLVELLELPQSLVSRHLAYLRRAGLVDVTRESKFAHYRLSAPTNPVHRSLLNCIRSAFSGIASLDKERRRAEARIHERESDPCD